MPRRSQVTRGFKGKVSVRCGGFATHADADSVLRDLGQVIEPLKNRQGRLDRCMQAMGMRMPPAVLWQKIRALERVLPKGVPG